MAPRILPPDVPNQTSQLWSAAQGRLRQVTRSTHLATLQRAAQPQRIALPTIGRELDAGNLYYYYRARYYDPFLQRFISEDPAGIDAGTNCYAYREQPNKCH